MVWKLEDMPASFASLLEVIIGPQALDVKTIVESISSLVVYYPQFIDPRI